MNRGFIYQGMDHRFIYKGMDHGFIYQGMDHGFIYQGMDIMDLKIYEIRDFNYPETASSYLPDHLDLHQILNWTFLG